MDDYFLHLGMLEGPGITEDYIILPFHTDVDGRFMQGVCQYAGRKHFLVAQALAFHFSLVLASSEFPKPMWPITPFSERKRVTQNSPGNLPSLS